MQRQNITIAIDGFSSCGKSTMARELAREIGYIYVDTGAMYRGIGWAAAQRGLIDDEHIDEAGIGEMLKAITLEFRLAPDGSPLLHIDGKPVEAHIRTIEVGALASRVATLPAVREAMVLAQRRMGESGGVVMDGRDIGTVVFPDAELKVFVTADPKVRAERRLKELQEKGDESLKLEDVQRSIEERDYNDTHRAVAPLRQAEDAIVLDNTTLTRAEQAQRLKALYHEALERANA